MNHRFCPSSTVTAYVLLSFTMLFWAGNYTIGRWASGTIPPVTLAFLRWSGATLLILPFAWSAVRRDAKAIRQNFKILLVLGLTGSGLFNTLQYIALTDTTAANAGIINSTGPIMIVLMSFLVNREAISARQLAGIAISTAGVLCVMSQGALTSIYEFSFRNGDWIMLLAIGLWAFYSVLLAKRPDISFLSFAFVTYAVAAVLNALLATIEIYHGASITWSPKIVAAISYTAIFPSLLAYLFYNRGVEILGPARASPFMHLVPVFTILLATTFLGEHFALHHALGLSLIVVGIYTATTREDNHT